MNKFRILPNCRKEPSDVYQLLSLVTRNSNMTRTRRAHTHAHGRSNSDGTKEKNKEMAIRMLREERGERRRGLTNFPAVYLLHRHLFLFFLFSFFFFRLATLKASLFLISPVHTLGHSPSRFLLLSSGLSLSSLSFPFSQFFSWFGGSFGRPREKSVKKMIP